MKRIFMNIRNIDKFKDFLTYLYKIKKYTLNVFQKEQPIMRKFVLKCLFELKCPISEIHDNLKTIGLELFSYKIQDIFGLHSEHEYMYLRECIVGFINYFKFEFKDTIFNTRKEIAQCYIQNYVLSVLSEGGILTNE